MLLLLLSLLAERKEHVITRTYHVTFSENTIHENQQLNERLVLRDVNGTEPRFDALLSDIDFAWHF